MRSLKGEDRKAHEDNEHEWDALAVKRGVVTSKGVVGTLILLICKAPDCPAYWALDLPADFSLKELKDHQKRVEARRKAAPRDQVFVKVSR